MATFVLKKYSDKDQQHTDTPKEEDSNKDHTPTVKNDNLENPIADKEAQKEQEMIIEVTGSISGLVANALHKVLGNKNVNLTIRDDEDDEQVDSTVKAISTEDINDDPIKAFNFIKPEDVVFIENKGFNTQKEEWFLTNVQNKTDNVFYTVESFGNFLLNKFENSFNDPNRGLPVTELGGDL